MPIPELNAIEKRPLCSIRTVSGQQHTLALSQDEAIAGMQQAMSQGASFVMYPTIRGKIVLNLGAVESIEPFEQKGRPNAE